MQYFDSKFIQGESKFANAINKELKYTELVEETVVQIYDYLRCLANLFILSQQ